MIVALLLSFIAASAAKPDYAAVLDGLWKQTDANKDDKLSLTEFTVALDKLDIDESKFTLHEGKASVFFAAIDKNNDGGLTKEELAGSMNDFKAYESLLRSGFTNGAGEVPKGVPTPSQGMAKSTAKVTMELEVKGKVSDIYPGQRKKIKAYFAQKCNVPPEDVLVIFVDKKTATARRQLQTADAVLIQGTAYVADPAAAEAAKAALPTSAGDLTGVPAFSGIEVTAIAVGTIEKPDISYTEPAIAGGVLIGGSVFLCIFAQMIGSKKAKAKGAKGGCCSTGCCSFYAVKPWAFGEFLTCLAIAGTVFYLYQNMTGLTNILIGLIDTLVALSASKVDAVKAMASMIPADIVSIVNQNKGYFPLLPFAVMGPGALCIVFLLLSSVCPLFPGHKGSYCVSKCFMFLTNIFLLISFIFYIIFAALALVLKFAPPQVQRMIGMLTGMCETIPPTLTQLVTDNTQAINQLKEMGQSVPELESMLNDVRDITTTINNGCGYINDLFVEVFNIFMPGVLCVVAICFAFFVNNTLCCAAGCCCKGPPKAVAAKAEGVTPASGVSQSV